MATTQPVNSGCVQAAPHLVIAPSWKDPTTGALYIHADLEQAQAPWEEEDHIPPMRRTENFGDVESFVAYVKRFGDVGAYQPLLTWCSRGLVAILDYASGETPEVQSEPGRCQWQATLRFVPSVQWQAWTSLANGQPVSQKQAVEKLEDLAEDIKEPAPADLMGLLRSLRASVNAKADAELRPDGTTSIAFTRDTAVKSGTSLVDLPSAISIAIPVLKGHVAEGKPVVYRVQVRVRVSVDDSAHLALRFSIPNAERILEATYEDRVSAAKALLGDQYQLLRAAD
jgi:hypothetical protein